MKKIIIFSIFAIVLASCSDFLNIRPEGSTLSSSMDYSKSENIFKPVSAAYASLRSGNVHGFGYICALEISSDNADKGSTPEDNPTAGEFQDMSFTESNTLLNDLWIGYYDVVSAANNAIYQMGEFDKATKNEENKAYIAQCLGEAKFIRAYAYFSLVRMFGNIPVIDKTLSSAELAAQMPKKPLEVYAFIEQDLEDAAAVLPESYQKSEAGRVTRYTAMALKAKVHLYKASLTGADKAAEMTMVATLADAVMASGKFALENDFRYVFSMDGENCKESVFEIQCSTLGKTTGEAPYTEYAYYQGPRGNAPANMQGWGFCVPSDDLIAFYNERRETIRPATTLLYRGSTTPEGDTIKESSVNPVYNGKVYVPSSYNKWSYNGYGFDYNIRILRYSDVLLMFAEAMVSGAAPESVTSGYSAQSALDEVRTRAGLGSTAPTLENIWDERRAELSMEEDRYLDLVRTGQAAGKIKGFVAGKHELFPIPANQRQLNTNLEQNPGY